ncbi:DUF6894 family protein [Rhizobium lentis]|uniref:DUF6894 family protein n=1 Tax=Rhizobium lentis TaxID=1138194 RepID=UPI00391852E1
MPKFYFHIRHAGHSVQDPEGSSFADLREAKHEATECLRELVAHALLSRNPDIPIAIEIYDADGELVALVPIDAAIPQLVHRACPGRNRLA